MTVEQELHELADHELDVMRRRLEELASKWETDAPQLHKLAFVYEQRLDRKSMYWLGRAERQTKAARQLRNVLAGRDAEDDGR